MTPFFIFYITRPVGREGSKGSKGSEGSKGGGSALRAMNIKSALRDLLSVSYGMIRILMISRYAAPPYPVAPLDTPSV